MIPSTCTLALGIRTKELSTYFSDHRHVWMGRWGKPQNNVAKYRVVYWLIFSNGYEVEIPYEGTTWVVRPDGGSVDAPGYWFTTSITVSKTNSYVTMRAEMSEECVRDSFGNITCPANWFQRATVNF